MKTRVAVVGATGYSGAELCALLHRHPRVELTRVQSSAGRKESMSFASLHPSLRGQSGPTCEAFSIDALANVDVVFLATPNETSAELARAILERGARVIDLSGAFRLPDAEHARWYGFARPTIEAAYNIPELSRASLREARLIANPGCYATSVILALAPILELAHGSEAIIADCKSGVSGAGKRSELGYSFSELSGNFKAYAASGHRHEPEIKIALGMRSPFVFVPHLLPVVRGILSTIYVPLSSAVGEDDIARRFADAYESARFVDVLPHGELPTLNDVVGTPRCTIGFQLLERRLVIVSALDNLLKGAASQAVQQLNLACGFGETDGLF